MTASGACVCWSLCSDCGLLLFLRVRADVAVDEICENDRFRCVHENFGAACNVLAQNGFDEIACFFCMVTLATRSINVHAQASYI